MSSAKWRPFCPGGDELTRNRSSRCNLSQLKLAHNGLSCVNHRHIYDVIRKYQKDVISIPTPIAVPNKFIGDRKNHAFAKTACRTTPKCQQLKKLTLRKYVEEKKMTKVFDCFLITLIYSYIYSNIHILKLIYRLYRGKIYSNMMYMINTHTQIYTHIFIYNT